MIIWLASYPRSGNTLTRIILKTCFDLNSHSDHPMGTIIGQESVATVGEATYSSDWPSFYEHARKSPELFYIKTHRPPIDDSPCIYIVRDGRASSCSYYDFMGTFFPEARLSLLQIVLGDDYNGDWSEHYAAWMNRPNTRTLVLKFDQLPDASPEIIQTIADFIGYRGHINSWVNPLNELRTRDPGFFREGKITWTPPSSWTPFVDFIFWHRHRALMQTLGYPGPAQSNLAPECQESLVTLNRLSNEWQRQKAELVKICDERQVVIHTLDKACVERLHALELNHQAVEANNTLIERQQATIQSLNGELTAKEACIQELVAALHGRKRSRRIKLPPFWQILRRKTLNFICKTRFPLGVLRQYTPKPLDLNEFKPRIARHSSPGFCILTPSFGQGRFIERTLRSVLDQNYPLLRYGVQDGGSTDETAGILAKYTGRLAYCDSRPDGGQADAINFGFHNMQPKDDEIMAWLNSDDLLLPGTLGYVGEYFASHPTVDAVYGHRIIIDDNDHEVGRWLLAPHADHTLKWVDYVPQETLFWRTSAWKRVGGLDASFQFALDWSFLAKLEDSGCVIKRLPRFLGCFRVHAHQKTHLNMNNIGLLEMNRIRQRNNADAGSAEQHIRNAVVRQTRASGLTHRLWSLGIKI